MQSVLTKLQVGANALQDMVEIRLGDLRPLVPYQISFQIDQYLRLACKEAAAHYNAPASIWRGIETEDLRDIPATHRGFRRSKLVSNVGRWEVTCNPPLVGLFFDGRGYEVELELGVKLATSIRRAGRIAKAWAGDTGRHLTMAANLTDANAPRRH